MGLWYKVENSEKIPLNIEPQQNKTNITMQQEKRKWNKENESWIADDC
jgi:hypothetical protein